MVESRWAYYYQGVLSGLEGRKKGGKAIAKCQKVKMLGVLGVVLRWQDRLGLVWPLYKARGASPLRLLKLPVDTKRDIEAALALADDGNTSRERKPGRRFGFEALVAAGARPEAAAGGEDWNVKIGRAHV